MNLSFKKDIFFILFLERETSMIISLKDILTSKNEKKAERKQKNDLIIFFVGKFRHAIRL